MLAPDGVERVGRRHLTSAREVVVVADEGVADAIREVAALALPIAAAAISSSRIEAQARPTRELLIRATTKITIEIKTSVSQ